MKRALIILAAAPALFSLGACNNKTAETAQPALPNEWSVPDVYQGEWRLKAEDCGKPDAEGRFVLTSDRVDYDGASGTVMASSIHGDQLDIIFQLTKDGTTWRRVYAFRLSPDLTTLTEVAGTDSPGLERVHCPAAGAQQAGG